MYECASAKNKQWPSRVEVDDDKEFPTNKSSVKCTVFDAEVTTKVHLFLSVYLKLS